MCCVEPLLWLWSSAFSCWHYWHFIFLPYQFLLWTKLGSVSATWCFIFPHLLASQRPSRSVIRFSWFSHCIILGCSLGFHITELFFLRLCTWITWLTWLLTLCPSQRMCCKHVSLMWLKNRRKHTNWLRLSFHIPTLSCALDCQPQPCSHTGPVLLNCPYPLRVCSAGSFQHHFLFLFLFPVPVCLDRPLLSDFSLKPLPACWLQLSPLHLHPFHQFLLAVCVFVHLIIFCWYK